MTTKPKTKLAATPAVKKTRIIVPQATKDVLAAQVCSELERGLSLYQACEAVQGAPSASTFLGWVERDPSLKQQYTHARARGYALLAEEINELAHRTHEVVMVHKRDAAGNLMYDVAGEPLLEKALVTLSPDVVALRRLQIDTKKWVLSKMLPKVYGDKVVQEHTGADGGPIQMAAVNLKGLSDDELAQMQKLMSKAGEAK
jgi:hypothetical protein